ncbi:MAG: hypothetical protein LIO68_04330 [Rikenellaceae bacterium]|nr:hypothetical protein [Rikenellaceae bacterium]
MILYPENSEKDFVVLNCIGYALDNKYVNIQTIEDCDFSKVPDHEPVVIVGHGEPPTKVAGVVQEPTLAGKEAWQVAFDMDNIAYKKDAPILLISCYAGVPSEANKEDSFVHLLASQFPGVPVTGKRGIALFAQAIPVTVIDPAQRDAYTALEIDILTRFGFWKEKMISALEIDWGTQVGPFPKNAGIEEKANFVYRHPKTAQLYRELRQRAQTCGYILPPNQDTLTFTANE